MSPSDWENMKTGNQEIRRRQQPAPPARTNLLGSVFLLPRRLEAKRPPPFFKFVDDIEHFIDQLAGRGPCIVNIVVANDTGQRHEGIAKLRRAAGKAPVVGEFLPPKAGKPRR